MALTRSMMRRAAVAWQKGAGNRIPTTTRAVNTEMNDNCPILISPSLVSLDLPEIWPTNSTTHDFPLTCKCSDEQTAAIIDGKSIADEIMLRISCEVRRMKESIGKVPGLAVILVGHRRDSQTYVRNKIKACEEAGIKSLITELPDNCEDDEVLNALSRFNKEPSVHGILVQLPLPQHLNVGKILDLLSLEKDVDGFHPLNMGNLAMRGREPLFIPCTPKGCIELLIRSGLEIMGKKAVVIGRSNIVGLPTSLLLQVTPNLSKFTANSASLPRLSRQFVSQRHHATVSIVHAFTRNPEQITCEADIVVAAAGVPNLVRGNWLKPGAVVIDVGTNPIEDPGCEHGYRLTGDVCYEEAVRVASAITPVPGGVGPMTIAMLLSNTLDSAKRAYDFP